MHEAMYYEKLDKKQVQCCLCPHHCVLSQEQAGICLVRKNVDGNLYTLNYGKLSAIAIDPIEKKPLYHFMKKSHVLSVGSYGCNMKCSFCQNSDISREFNILDCFTSPSDIVEEAIRQKLPGIAYTYNEPTVFYEWMIETMHLAKDRGLKNIIVSNGYIEKEPLEALAPLIDAMNIDVKTYDDAKYQEVCAGRLEPVLTTIDTAVKHNIHVELTCLIVPELNDDVTKSDVFFSELYQRFGDLPLHISRYFPRYHYDASATNIQLMLEIKEQANKFFSNIHLGNVR